MNNTVVFQVNHSVCAAAGSAAGSSCANAIIIILPGTILVSGILLQIHKKNRSTRGIPQTD